MLEGSKLKFPPDDIRLTHIKVFVNANKHISLYRWKCCYENRQQVLSCRLLILPIFVLWFHINSKIKPTTTITSQITATNSFKMFFIMLILQTDYDIFYVGGGFPPHFSVDALNHHFDDGYESSNFGGKLSECLDHFYQLAYFLVHLHASFLLLMILLHTIFIWH